MSLSIFAIQLIYHSSELACKPNNNYSKFYACFPSCIKMTVATAGKQIALWYLKMTIILHQL